MKKLATFAFAMLLTATLSFAQDTGDKTKTNSPQTSNKAGKKATKTSKAHKGGKKSKKGQGTDTTTPPK